MNMNHHAFRIFAIAFASFSTSQANDFETEDFSLRFSAALSRLSTFGDVSGQSGASAASVRSTSLNPAALAWRPLIDGEGHRLSLALSGQYNGLFFDRGAQIDAISQSMSFYPAENWALKLSATQLRSNEEPLRSGLVYEVDLNAWRLDIAHRFSRRFALGIQLAYSESETNATLGQFKRDSDRRSFAVRFGWQVSLLPGTLAALRIDPKASPATSTPNDNRLLAALVFDYVNQPTKLGTFTPFGSTVERREYQQFLVRGGLAWNYINAPWGGSETARRSGFVRLDYQWGWFFSPASELQVHRLYLGGDYPITPFLHANAGVNLDARRNISWSAGLSFLTHTVALEAAYQHDLLPEIGRDFGHADVVVVSVGYAF